VGGPGYSPLQTQELALCSQGKTAGCLLSSPLVGRVGSEALAPESWLRVSKLEAGERQQNLLLLLQGEGMEPPVPSAGGIQSSSQVIQGGHKQ
jgi:hypothetical protein